jgi:L-alanine-DL-glutamate epimerase-like enolase superfamily enzyme
MQISPHFVMELHLPLVAAVSNSLFVEYIPSLDRVLTQPLELVDGCFVPAEMPGLGIPFDWELLREFKVDNANR